MLKRRPRPVPVLTAADQERFWAKVDKTPVCWLWTASVNSTGFGQFTVRHILHMAHRVAYAIAFGALDDGAYVYQTCGIHRCVHPNHLAVRRSSALTRADWARLEKSPLALRREPRPPKPPQTDRQCPACGKDFTVSAKRARRGGSPWCSRVCAAKSQDRRQQGASVTCPQCGEAFYLKPHKQRIARLVYCSRICQMAYRRSHPESHPTFRGGYEPYYGPNWLAQARLARARDGYTCQSCGLQRQRPALHVHHKRPLRCFDRDYEAANALHNLITLCGHCHRLAEQVIWRQDLAVSG